MAGDLVMALADLKEKETLEIAQQRLAMGDEPLKVLEDARRAMGVVGQRFASGEYFIPDLVYAGEILREVTDVVKPRLTGAAAVKKRGKVVVGTVAGDIHDIGKDLVVFMLDIAGFEVYDLGVDVPAAKFVAKTRETGAPVVALSGFLTLAFEAMRQTIETLNAEGLRNKTKVMIGGGLIDEAVCRYTGADAYGKDAMAAVRLAQGWLEGN